MLEKSHNYQLPLTDETAIAKQFTVHSTAEMCVQVIVQTAISGLSS